MPRDDLPSGIVTLVFTDTEGSTQLLRELGDRYADALADHRRILRSAFATGGGVEVDTQGDAFIVASLDVASALVAGRAMAFGDSVRIALEPHDEQFRAAV